METEIHFTFIVSPHCCSSLLKNGKKQGDGWIYLNPTLLQTSANHPGLMEVDNQQANSLQPETVFKTSMENQIPNQHGYDRVLYYWRLTFILWD